MVNKYTSGRKGIPLPHGISIIMIKFEMYPLLLIQKKPTVNAVRNVSFEVNKGDIFGIVGHSEAGKKHRCCALVNLLETMQRKGEC